DGEEILKGIEDIAGMQVNAYGGAAGDDYAFAQTFVFTNGRDSDNAMVCIALDETKVMIKGIATCGWKAVGTEKLVTKSEGNHVYTVENIPVLDITAKYGGLENVTPENNNLMVEIAANFPLQLQREKGDPIMRPGLVVDWTDRSFYTSGSVPQGSKVRFSLPPDWDVMEKVIKAVENLKATEMPEADALVVFSCAGRILSLGPLMSKELEGVKNVWNVPMAGMFSNAELGRATGGNLEMHNLTTCCIALKEK
ncbi:MAG TPA: FIST N-terminal domain-containing protein, partial [Chitinophagaceae bacterium]